MTTLVMAGLFLFGGRDRYLSLPVADLPRSTSRRSTWARASRGRVPETMASAVATPLERQFSGIAGIDSMNSTSSPGLDEHHAQFSLDRDIDAAAQDVQDWAIAGDALAAPAVDAEPARSLRKVNPSMQPVLFIVLSSRPTRCRVASSSRGGPTNSTSYGMRSAQNRRLRRSRPGSGASSAGDS